MTIALITNHDFLSHLLDFVLDFSGRALDMKGFAASHAMNQGGCRVRRVDLAICTDMSWASE
jgi:hypothetical protein